MKNQNSFLDSVVIPVSIILSIFLVIGFIISGIHKITFGFWLYEDYYSPVTQVEEGDNFDYAIYARDHAYKPFNKEEIFCVYTYYKGERDYVVTDVENVGKARCKLEKEIVLKYQQHQTTLEKSSKYLKQAKENLKNCQ